jgi:hypothetical protein
VTSFECVGGLPGLLNQSITAEQLGFQFARTKDSGRCSFCQLYWQSLPAYLIQGDHQVQEVHIPDLSREEFELLLDSFGFAFFCVKKTECAINWR